MTTYINSLNPMEQPFILRSQNGQLSIDLNIPNPLHKFRLIDDEVYTLYRICALPVPDIISKSDQEQHWTLIDWTATEQGAWIMSHAHEVMVSTYRELAPYQMLIIAISAYLKPKHYSMYALKFT